MKQLFAGVALLAAVGAIDAAPHPFDVHDLVMLDRVSDPQLSADGHWLAWQQRQTDYAANKGVNGIWLLDLRDKNAKPQQLVKPDVMSATSPRWSPDGQYVYFLAKAKDSQNTQVWRLHAHADAAETPTAVTTAQADINAYRISPDGKSVLLSIDAPSDCADFGCVVKAQNEKPTSKASGRVYDKLFIRHWDTWADGKRSQLFIAPVADASAKAPDPLLLSRGIDGDIPSKPFGDDGEFSFSADSRMVYFDARIAGTSEPWSTNFDVYSVPADASSAPKNLTVANKAWDAHPVASHDGKTLYYLAMKRPAFEADRFGIMALDLASGKTREIDPHWDRSGRRPAAVG